MCPLAFFRRQGLRATILPGNSIPPRHAIEFPGNSIPRWKKRKRKQSPALLGGIFPGSRRRPSFSCAHFAGRKSLPRGAAEVLRANTLNPPGDALGYADSVVDEHSES